MNKYRFYIPGHIYYIEFYGEDEAEARSEARNWLQVKRLPSGTHVEEARREVWIYQPEFVD